ncbi:hypothetical protein [Helicobacter muridarum]|uniref:hypothetical protein n=1 Tax=Helicobacter muridarum TaxID=216 RepID=UPI001F3E921E|nr:hypothetical protein [Helicobacter muridarum]
MPVSKTNKLCFNAHRVFHPQTIIEVLDYMQVLEVSFIKGFDTQVYMEYRDGELFVYDSIFDSLSDKSKDYVVGLFEFRKKPSILQ